MFFRNLMLAQNEVKQSHYGPGVAQRVQEVKVLRFHDKGTGWW
jgi:predicted GNAT family acetyltransferase